MRVASLALPVFLLLACGGEPVKLAEQAEKLTIEAPKSGGARRYAIEPATSKLGFDMEAPVEKIRGPVMCLSATDDGSWPSSLYSRMVTRRLAETEHPWPVQHLDFEGGGHSIVFPYVPTTQLVYAHPVSGRLSTTGGTPAANAHADEASWAGVCHFLQQAVAARATAV